MEIKNAKVLITGGSSGIGYATAKRLVDLGAKVVICGRKMQSLEKAAKEIGAYPVAADVSIEADVKRLVKESIDHLEGLNVLINNAAYGQFGPLTEIDTVKFNELLATNVTGAMMVGRECARYFIANDYGNIVNIASSAGRGGFAGGTAYVASKFALAGMTECWRAELRKSNIRVMLVNPSEVQTNFVPNAGMDARPHSVNKLEAEDIAHTIASLLQIHDRGFVTEASVWATNPR